MEASLSVKYPVFILLSALGLALISETAASDPTQPFFAEVSRPLAAAPARLNLQAIYRRDNRMEVVINDVLLKEGDYILGARIGKIERDRVHYTQSKKNGVLTLHQRFLKKAKVEG